MDELRERVRGKKWFTKLDLKNGYHLIRMKTGDEWKTAFRCRYGLFEYTVMPFGLMNAPATFQKMINSIFNDMLDQGMLAFLDDITINAETIEELDKLTIKILKRRRDNVLCIAPDKCEWQKQEIEFLCYTLLAGRRYALTPGVLSTSTYRSAPKLGHVRYPAEES